MSETASSDNDLIAHAMTRLDEPSPPGAQPSASEKPDTARQDPDMPWAPSPTLAALDPRRRPSPATLCQGCPNAVWFTSPKEVRCYCRVMYITVWSNKEPNQITGCDGIWIGQDE